jgi:hypothetical protein
LENRRQKAAGFDLLDRLDLKKVSLFGDKKSVKTAALAVGLKT